MDEDKEMIAVHEWLDKDIELLCKVMGCATVLVDYHYTDQMFALKEALIEYYAHRNKGIV